MKKDTNENPSAFSCAAGDEFLQEGMTLRDYFAAKVLSSNMTGWGDSQIKEQAEVSYKMADAMLKARLTK